MDILFRALPLKVIHAPAYHNCWDMKTYYIHPIIPIVEHM